jgi:hypothetical protein
MRTVKIQALRWLCGILLCWLLTGNVAAETSVLFTVDVESYQGRTPERDIFGRLPGYEGEYGVPKMLEILAEEDSPATFYLNVYELPLHGEKPLQEITNRIREAGQDLQLHTHPHPMFGRRGMSHFKQSEQREILAQGKALLEGWGATNIVAHRAGAYLANTATLRALRQVGIAVDASLSPAVMSPLAREGHLENDVFTQKGVLELPVTYYTQLRLPGWSSARFLDIESSSLPELISVLDQMAGRKACAVNIMMHSFSFTRSGVPDEHIMERFREILRHVEAHPELTARSTRGFLSAWQQGDLECSPAPGFVPHTGFWLTWRRAWERLGQGGLNVAVALAPLALVSCLLFVVVWRLRGRRA